MITDETPRPDGVRFARAVLCAAAASLALVAVVVAMVTF